MIIVLNGKKFKKFRNERSEANGENVEMKGGRGRRGQRKWDKFRTNENSESDSIEEKNAEEIKKEIGSLKEEMQLLMEKKKGLWGELAGLKEKVKNLRMNNGAKEDIVKLREEMFEKKKVAQGYQMQIGISRFFHLNFFFFKLYKKKIIHQFNYNWFNEPYAV